jgi:hypothetical protein
MDSPNPQAGCYVDLLVFDEEFTIDCPKAGGYGLSSVPVDGFGGGSDELFDEIEPLLDRIAKLVATKSRTEPQPATVLKELRMLRKAAQGDIAAKLGVKQPTVSRMEYQEDVGLSTLRKYVQALGGTLEVHAVFPDRTISIDLGKLP